MPSRWGRAPPEGVAICYPGFPERLNMPRTATVLQAQGRTLDVTDATPQDGRLTLDRDGLKRHRQRLGLSQEALAQHCFDRRLCVSIASIKRAESGRPVLYRTARHLAEVYGVPVAELAAPDAPALDQGQAGGPPAAADLDALALDDESPRSLIRLVADGDAASLRRWVTSFGGTPAQGGAGVGLFGLPRAYRSDAERSLRCGLALLEQGHCRGVRLEAFHWPAETPVEPEPPHSPGLWVARGLAVQLAEHYAFAGDEGAFLRYLHPLADDQGARFDLVGRHVEVGQLLSVLESTCAYQCGHLVYVRGVAGIGKTRLSDEFVEMARPRADLHQATVLDFGARVDEGPLEQLARSLLATRGEAVLDEACLMARLAALRLPADHAMLLRPLVGLAQPPEHARLHAAMTPETRTRRRVTALRELILARAIHRPQLLLVEDLHWADETLLATLTALLQGTLEAPVIWLFTSRLEQDPLEKHLRPQLADLPLSLIELAPLRAAEAEALVAGIGGIEPEHAARCVEQAQGNPLFLTQLLLHHPHRALPASLTNLVQAKLDQLTAQDRRAVRIAAAIGQRFALSTLRELLGQADYLPELPQRHSLVRALGGDDYLFVHDLILRGIYEGIPKLQRDRLHLGLARYYAETDPGLCARHLHKARSLEAPGAFVRAIEAELARYRHAEALALLRQCQAIDYAPRDDFRLALLQGQIDMVTGRIHAAHDHFEIARRHARDDRQIIDASLGLARVLNMLDALDAEERLLDDILPLAETLGAHTALAEIHYLKGSLYFPRGDFATSRAWQGRALEQARLAGDVRTEIQALSGLGDAHYAEGRMRSTREHFEHCVALCREHGHADLEASNLFMLGTARIYANQTASALDDCLAAAELGERVGNRRAEVVARLTAGWILIARGEPEGANEQVSLALEVACALGSGRFEAFLFESRARIELIEGRQERARMTIRDAWRLVQQHGLQHFIGPWVLGTLALLEEAPGKRRATLAEGEALLDRGCVGHNGYRFLVTAAEVSLLDGRPADARHYGRRLSALMGEEPCAWGEHHLALLEAHARWLEAGDAAARTRLQAQWREAVAQGLAMTLPCLAAAAP